MEIIIKIATGHYERLRSRIPGESPAHQALERATRIDYSVDGVLFEGYSVSCDDTQAGLIREAAERYCPVAVLEIDKAIRHARDRGAL
ncbi:MAG TPA: hypothetical protein VNN77_08060 [candidate division Zixibacteria bacterium]|nr:hypothetical protein [candidate division Zixibacteria bacterium]